MTRTTIDDVVARSAISDTLHDYCRGVDRCDIELLTDLFMPDGAYDFGHGNVTTGRTDLRRLFRETTDRYTSTSHQVSTVSFLRIGRGSASTISAVYAFHEDTATQVHLHVWGCYEDELVDDGDRWRIAMRRFRVAGTSRTPAEPLPDRFERYRRGPADTARD